MPVNRGRLRDLKFGHVSHDLTRSQKHATCLRAERNRGNALCRGRGRAVAGSGTNHAVDDVDRHGVVDRDVDGRPGVLPVDLKIQSVSEISYFKVHDAPHEVGTRREHHTYQRIHVQLRPRK